VPTCHWAARESGPCSNALGTARHCLAPRTVAHCVLSHPPAAPQACWGAGGGLGGEKTQAGERWGLLKRRGGALDSCWHPFPIPTSTHMSLA
jgi:hypothetical protein